ncbi:hypothetical protein BB561_004857 [Smittium simulii]|uniref:ATP synthase F(0) complex subunit e, mitochondrial n=1 Tax=Smittium simulii TaxID=133385 RepID=A0A2T9YDT0_9FUNG|nr:hypothetical protein BB561_006683 [Smittium simulii]PVU90497.1 hypothetical protein BB561_004857 [Smittium simulii]
MQAAPIRKVSPLYLLTRYAAIGLGVSYGFLHARTLRDRAAHHRLEDEYNNKVELISKAKEAFEESKRPKTLGGPVDFENPNFDFEAWARTLE